jgi:hypothetical protein
LRVESLDIYLDSLVHLHVGIMRFISQTQYRIILVTLHYANEAYIMIIHLHDACPHCISSTLRCCIRALKEMTQQFTFYFTFCNLNFCCIVDCEQNNNSFHKAFMNILKFNSKLKEGRTSKSRWPFNPQKESNPLANYFIPL